MASAATATGATITEVRVTGCKGLSAAVAGRLSSSVLPEEKRFSAHSVPEKNSDNDATPSDERADRQAEGQGRLFAHGQRQIIAVYKAVLRRLDVSFLNGSQPVPPSWTCRPSDVVAIIRP